MKRRPEAVEEIAIAGDRTGVDQRQQELRIVRFDPGELVELADLVADDQPEIPERVQQLVRARRSSAAFERAVEQHEQIDVRVQAEVPAAVAAEREHDRRRRVAERIGEQLGHQIVDGAGVSRQRLAAGLPACRGGGQFVARGRQPRARRPGGVGVRFGAGLP